MEEASNQLPDDIDLLKSLLVEQAIKLDKASTQKQQLLARNEQLQADQQTVVQKNKHLQAQVLTLQEQRKRHVNEGLA